MLQVLSTEDIQKQAPSVYADKPWEGASEHYSFLSSANVVQAMVDRGLVPVRVSEARTRIEGKRGYTKHLIRFRPVDSPVLVGGVTPEIIFINSHDRGSSYIVEHGLYRGACANGLVVKVGTFGRFTARHSHQSLDNVLEATYRILDEFPKVEELVRRYQAVSLTDLQRQRFAELAMGLRWDADKVPFEAARLLSYRRVEDKNTDLWSTMNVIQENLIQGQNMRFARNARTTRAVKSIDADLAINRGIFELAEAYAN